jgi:hypothetical protein
VRSRGRRDSDDGRSMSVKQGRARAWGMGAWYEGKRSVGHEWWEAAGPGWHGLGLTRRIFFSFLLSFQTEPNLI